MYNQTNNQPEAEAETLKLQQKLTQLEQELRDCIDSEKLLETGAGQVLLRFLTTRVNLHMRDITSNKFKRDHSGYVSCLEALNEDKWLLSKIQVAANPTVQAKFAAKARELKQDIEDGAK